MQDDIRTNRTNDRAGMNSTSTGGLDRLRNLDDYKVADGYPDIRGWTVKGQNGQKFGKVHDLIVSTGDMRARYLDVEVEGDQHALVPIGTAQLDDDHDDVIVSGLTDYNSYPRFQHQSAISRDYEQQVHSRFHNSGTGTADVSYDHDHFDDQRLFAGRRRDRNMTDDMTDDERRLTLSEEELNVGTRRVQAGEVEVRKHVETEHVRENVPLMREEVTVERRAVSGDAARGATIGDDQEIRVPLMREEAVVEKRPVVREEIIIRKRAVQENQTVEADLRRERVDVDGLDDDNARRMNP